MDISKRDPKEIQQVNEDISHLTIQNAFIFCHVMRNKHLYERFLSRLLAKKIKIVEIIPQATIATSIEAKTVRLDILARDEGRKIANIHFQEFM